MKQAMLKYLAFVLVTGGLGLGGLWWVWDVDAQGALKAAKQITMYSATLSPTVLSVNTSAEQTFTVAGLRVGDAVFVNKPTVQAGIALCGARVTAANTLGICFANITAAVLTPTASQAYTIVGVRP